MDSLFFGIMIAKINRVSKLFDNRFPIVQAGMVWCSGWRLASAVSNAGGLGLLGAGSMYPEILRHHIRACKIATQHPFGVNIPLELQTLLGNRRAKLGIFEGDMEEGELEIGQISAAIKEIQSAEEIVKDLWDSFSALKKSMCYEVS